MTQFSHLCLIEIDIYKTTLPSTKSRCSFKNIFFYRGTPKLEDFLNFVVKIKPYFEKYKQQKIILSPQYPLRKKKKIECCSYFPK